MNRRILLGLTGSVASILYAKLIERLSVIGIVDVIVTYRTIHFIKDFNDFESLVESRGGKVYLDEDEWRWKRLHNDMDHPKDAWYPTRHWEANDPILHIELRNKASALVIAPCSLNTLAKISNGICDNLLTTIARAWDFTRPFIIAPAGNTNMWNHPITKKQIREFEGFSKNNVTILPQMKKLACGTEGIGAMGDISSIVDTLTQKLKWKFPLIKNECSGIPINGHPGSFLCKRKHHVHTGVDLYTDDEAYVYSVEEGTVVGIEHFTGPQDNQPWWNDTECVLIEGASGVVCYGEITPDSNIKVGDNVWTNERIGKVKRVLKEGKERPDIMGHSTSMLHLELYPHGKYKAFEEFGDNPDDFNILQDPTPYLLDSLDRPEKELT